MNASNSQQPVLPPHGSLDVFESPQQMSAAACEDLINLSRQRIEATGRFRVSLSGGSTPKLLYQLMAEQKAEFRWDQIELFWGDERNVLPEDEQSNFRMVREALLDHVPLPTENIHRVPIDPDRPEDTAQKYEETLRERFGSRERSDWDLVLLGMGDDAHTASLFPQTSAIDAPSGRLFVENWVPKFQTYRQTLTAQAINHAHHIWFMIAGAAKQQALGNVWSAPRNVHEYPSQLIQPEQGMLRWMVTHDALPS